MILCAWCNKDIDHHTETETDQHLKLLSQKIELIAKEFRSYLR